MNLILALIAIVLIARPLHSQRIRARQAPSSCATPERYTGSCTQLSYCPQIANVFKTQSQQVAQRYILASQRSCGTQSVNGDPLVCCTRPVEPLPISQRISPTNPFLPSTRGPQTRPQTTNNPFFPTQATSTPVRVTRAPEVSAPLIDNRATACRDPDARPGVCVALQSCKVLLDELLSKPNDATFANFLRASNRICGSTATNVCCPSAQVRTTSAPAGISNSIDVPRRLPTVQEGCGYTGKSFKKIVGGEVSQKGAWPWIALLGYDDGLSSSPFKCGGTLVTARHVVTAAHCIRNDLTFVRLGEHDLTTDSEAAHQDIRVVRRESHPDYNRKNGRSDIALLYLEQNVQFNAYVSPICLPTTNELRRKSYVSYTPFVAGWGKTMEGGRSANVLQELQIPIYQNAVCQESYRKQNRLFTTDQFDSAVICAGVLSGGKDTCQGDSGGPLMIPEPYGDSVRYYLVGVVSYGIGCARPDIPGVYTSVQYFIDWIIRKVAETQ